MAISPAVPRDDRGMRPFPVFKTAPRPPPAPPQKLPPATLSSYPSPPASTPTAAATATGADRSAPFAVDKRGDFDIFLYDATPDQAKIPSYVRATDAPLGAPPRMRVRTAAAAPGRFEERASAPGARREQWRFSEDGLQKFALSAGPPAFSPSSPSYLAFDEADPASAAPQQGPLKRQLELELLLRDAPQNVAGWEELAALQADILGTAAQRSLAEKRAAIYEKALGKNAQSEELLVSYLRCQSVLLA